MADPKIVLTAVDNTRAAIDTAKRNLSGLGDMASSLPAKFGTLGVAIAGVFATATFKGVIDVLDRLDDLAEKSGESVEALSALRYAGEVTGTAFDALAAGMRKLPVTLSEAARGNKEAQATFAAMGVAVTTVDGSLRKQGDVLLDIADKFASYNDGAAKAALAQRIFGKSGEEMIPLLNQGRAGIEQLRGEAERLGVVYSGDLARAAAKFNDDLKRLELNAEGAKVAILGDNGLLDAVNRLVSGFLALKEAALVWTVIKDAAKGVVGLNSLTSDPGADINRLMAQREKLLGEREAAQRKLKSPYGAATPDYLKSLDDQLLQNDLLLQTSRVRQQRQVLGEGGDFSDAVSRRMARGRGGRRDAPTVRQPASDAQEQAALSFLQQLNREYANLTGSLTKVAEVEAQLTLKGAKFTEEQKEQARAIAKSIDVWKARAALVESQNKGLSAEAEIASELADRYTDSVQALMSFNREQKEQIQLLGLLPEQQERVTYYRKVDLELTRALQVLDEQRNQQLISQAEYLRSVASATGIAQQAKQNYERVVGDRRDQAYNPDRGFADAMRDYRDFLARGGDAAREATTRTLGSIEDATLAFAKGQKGAWKSVVDTIITEFARLKVVRPLMAEIFGSGGSGASVLGKIFGFGASGGGSAGPSWFQNDMGGFELAGSLGFHTGGIVGVGQPTFRRLVPMSLFDHATRYHTGGIAGDEVPAILKRGEGVFTKEQMEALGGGRGGSGDLKVTIVNNTSAPIGKVTQRTIAPDERALIIEEAVAATAATFNDPNSYTSRSLARNFTASRRR
jgi:lambda family phage tail tape measure protein